MELEVGKSYRTRAGVKVDIIEQLPGPNSDCYVGSTNGGTSSWYPDGHWLPSGGESDYDLVELWEEVPSIPHEDVAACIVKRIKASIDMCKYRAFTFDSEVSAFGGLRVLLTLMKRDRTVKTLEMHTTFFMSGGISSIDNAIDVYIDFINKEL